MLKKGAQNAYDYGTIGIIMKTIQPSGTILIVEDLLENILQLTQMLTLNGFKIRTAKTGREAIASVNSELPDLILLDIILPDIDGYKVCTTLKANKKTSAVPVIFVSALNESADKIRGFAAGGVDFITKPFIFNEFLFRLRTHIEISHLRSQMERQAIELQLKNTLLQGEVAERKLANEKLVESFTKLKESKTAALNLLEDLKMGIEQRKQSEKKLIESEERYKRITDGLTDYLYTVIVKDGKAIKTIHNEACLAVTGYTSKEFEAKPYLWINMVVPEEKEFVAGRFLKILEGKELIPIEHRIIRKDGKIRWISDTSISKFNSNSELISYDGVIKDITERKQAEEELKKLNAGLEQRVRERTLEMEAALGSADMANHAKSDFLANMSHELRNPLNSIIGFIEVLQDSFYGGLNEKQREYLVFMEKSSRHLLALINDILDLSKVESGKIELELSEFSIKEVIEGSLVMIKEMALQQGISLLVTIDANADIKLTADERKIKQILFNLLSNAVKFTSSGGRVDVTAARRKNPAENGEPDEIMVCVKDTGYGIKPENMKLLFSRFSQLESPYNKKHEGTGLGLALSKNLVELHNGRIWVESEPGKGSSFIFTIPLSRNV